MTDYAENAEELFGGGECVLPRNVAICPECGGEIHVDCVEWDAVSGKPTQAGLDIACLADDATEPWSGEDNDVSHIYLQGAWQPVRDAIWQWINQV